MTLQPQTEPQQQAMPIEPELWLRHYPDNIDKNADFNRYSNLLEVFESACKRYAQRPAFSNMGQVLTYQQLAEKSAAFASFLQHHTDLQPGDRLAIQLPNVLQYPIVLFGALQAGLVVVNTNPLYTEREMTHQFHDSGAKALVVLENFADKVEKVLPNTSLEHIIVCRLGDELPRVKRYLVNAVVKYVKKMVPSHNLKQYVGFRDALKRGKSKPAKPLAVAPRWDDLAILQYTGGTTGVAKGAMLSHGNLISNMVQTNALLSEFKAGHEAIIAPLPMYHIFCFTVSCMAILELGCHSILITNPRDIPGFIKILRKSEFTAFAGLNTLFVALMKDPDFNKVDWSKLKLTISGGMALQKAIAVQWQDMTGCTICEGYGMTETSPVISVNPPGAVQIGTIGLPVLKTEIQIVNDNGEVQQTYSPGEIWVRGPQVMSGYWQRAEATEETITSDGWLKTGDIGFVANDGFVKIVDRKKDMILVSGFNVYPNEIEDVIASHPQVLECAVVGVVCEHSGEKIKLFVVKKDPALTEAQVRDYAKSQLTGYKVPKLIEFRDDLPKTNVGKILRRQLRDEANVA